MKYSFHEATESKAGSLAEPDDGAMNSATFAVKQSKNPICENRRNLRMRITGHRSRITISVRRFTQMVTAEDAEVRRGRTGYGSRLLPRNTETTRTEKASHGVTMNTKESGP